MKKPSAPNLYKCSEMPGISGTKKRRAFFMDLIERCGLSKAQAHL